MGKKKKKRKVKKLIQIKRKKRKRKCEGVKETQDTRSKIEGRENEKGTVNK